MSKSITTIQIIQKLCALGERQFVKETEAREIICGILRDNDTNFRIQSFSTFIPLAKKVELLANGKIIPAINTGFVSGTISDNYSILSSLISSQNNLYDPNINFNPRSDGISRSNHYFAPSLAISKSDLPILLNAKKVQGNTVVVKTKHDSANILVGNCKNPRSIIFCHYDSLDTGASDNASGTALCLDLVIRNPKLLETTLVVFAGNEELSYDEPVYWGHGYRVFERRFAPLLKDAEQILVLDSLGTGETELSTNPKLTKLAFPLLHGDRYSHKIKVLCGEYDSLMPVYHSSLDTPKYLNGEYLKSAQQLLKQLLI